MKVILQRDIPKVGKGGEIVNVADGYYRNYLQPRNYAVAATGGALKEHTNRANLEKSRSAGLLAGAQADAAKIEGKELVILAKAGAGGRLFGSITAQDIADKIAAEGGVTVDKRRVGQADPIKTLGDYTVPVRLHSDVTVNMKVVVTTEEELAKRRAAEAAAAAKAAAEAAARAEEEDDEEEDDEDDEDETTAEADTGDSADGAEADSAGEGSPS